MAITSAPQLNKKWFERNMDGEWSKSLANVPKITKEVLLRFLVERVSDIHRNKKQAKKSKSSQLDVNGQAQGILSPSHRNVKESYTFIYIYIYI